MPQPSDLDLFERAVEARGRILRVEADRVGAPPRLLALTFDVGRIVVSARDDTVGAAHPTGRDELPDELVGLDEEEPWWRVLGQPVTAAWPGDVGEGEGASALEATRVLKLRFREQDENPRVVVLEATGDAVRVALEGD